ncbi:MAG: DUF3883 domain-containing protein, partial [Alphaproteobacteria bacterium]|nr:DUF3883 domain-containing protein [Alphaproteobacteria bacterium]
KGSFNPSEENWREWIKEIAKQEDEKRELIETFFIEFYKHSSTDDFIFNDDDSLPCDNKGERASLVFKDAKDIVFNDYFIDQGHVCEVMKQSFEPIEGKGMFVVGVHNLIACDKLKKTGLNPLSEILDIQVHHEEETVKKTLDMLEAKWDMIRAILKEEGIEDKSFQDFTNSFNYCRQITIVVEGKPLTKVKKIKHNEEWFVTDAGLLQYLVHNFFSKKIGFTFLKNLLELEGDDLKELLTDEGYDSSLIDRFSIVSEEEKKASENEIQHVQSPRKQHLDTSSAEDDRNDKEQTEQTEQTTHQRGDVSSGVSRSKQSRRKKIQHSTQRSRDPQDGAGDEAPDYKNFYETLTDHQKTITENPLKASSQHTKIRPSQTAARVKKSDEEDTSTTTSQNDDKNNNARQVTGAYGEAVAYRELVALYGEEAVEWKSSNKTKFIDDNIYDDSCGYDMSVKLKSGTRYFEVKSSRQDDQSFSMTRNEMESAKDVAVSDADSYSILYVNFARDPEKSRVFDLGNPMKEGGEKMFQKETIQFSFNL